MAEACCNGASEKPQPNPTFLARILNKVFVSDVEKNRRMDICKACDDHFNHTFNQCKICGCFMEAKTRLQGFHCALDQIGETPKW
jgi:hypothetical protein